MPSDPNTDVAETLPVGPMPGQALLDMGPLLDEMDHNIERIQELLDNVSPTPPAIPAEPSAALVATVNWIKSQLDTDLMRLSHLSGAIAALTVPETTRSILNNNRSGLEFRVNQLRDQLLALEPLLGNAGAEDAVARLDAGTVAVTELIGRFETNVSNYGACPDGYWRAADGNCVPLVTITPVGPGVSRSTKPMDVTPVLIIGGGIAAVAAAILLTR